METWTGSRAKTNRTSTCALCFAVSSQYPVTLEELTQIRNVLGPLVPDVAGILEESCDETNSLVFCGECIVLLKEAARLHVNLQTLNAQLISVLVSVKSKIVDHTFEIKEEVTTDEEACPSDFELPGMKDVTAVLKEPNLSKPASATHNSDEGTIPSYSKLPETSDDNHSSTSSQADVDRVAKDSSLQQPEIRRSRRKTRQIPRSDTLLEEPNEPEDKPNDDEEYQPSESEVQEYIPQNPKDNHRNLIPINKSLRRKRKTQTSEDEDVQDIPSAAKKSKRLTKFTCTVCSINFRCKGDKLLHCESLHFQGAAEDVEGMCRLYSRICGKSSLTPADLSTHNETHHASSFKFKCSECDKKFTRPALVDAHLPTHSAAPFPCSLCLPKEMTFDTPLLLDNHILRVHVHAQKIGENYKSRRIGPECDNLKTKCKWCRFQQGNGLFELNNHQRKAHPEQFSFFCDYEHCKSSFAEANQAITCLESHKDHSGPFNCVVCDLTWPSGSELKEHLASVHAVGGLKCDECPELPLTSTLRFLSVTTLRNHKAQNHRGEWRNKCPLCPEGFAGASGLTDHLHCAHKDKDLGLFPQLLDHKSRGPQDQVTPCRSGWKCVWCGFKPRNTLFGLNNHQRMSHPEQFTFRCTNEDCNSTFSKESHALTCQETHRDHSGPFNCVVCHFSCPTGSDLKEHLASQHTIGGVKCDACPEGPLAFSKRFPHKTSLKFHTARHHGGEWPHKCPFCPRGFDAPYTLTDHLRSTHKNQTVPSILVPESLNCKDCTMKFQTRNALLTHRQIVHRGLNTECEECGKKIISRDGMKAHMKIHRGIKDHICQFCGKGFVCPAVLKVHLRTHTGEKPYACHICGKTFSQASVRSKHSAKHKADGTWREKPSVT